MITVQYSHYLPFLASGNDLLVLGNERYDALEAFREHFHSFIQHALDGAVLEELDATLLHHKTNIVVLDARGNVSLARSFFDAIKQHNPRIIVIVITTIEAAREELELMKDANATLFAPFTQQQLNAVLFSMLGIFYVIKSIGRRAVSLKTNANEAVNQDYFLDQYQGAALFIVDDLSELNGKLMHGELSYELLGSIADKLSEISKIFLLSNDFAPVSPVIDDLVRFIKRIDLAEIEPGMLKAFDYLADIIDDVNVNILDLFVDRIIKNVEEFYHSLESNIEYIKAVFLKQETKSEAEFFA